MKIELDRLRYAGAHALCALVIALWIAGCGDDTPSPGGGRDAALQDANAGGVGGGGMGGEGGGGRGGCGGSTGMVCDAGEMKDTGTVDEDAGDPTGDEDAGPGGVIFTDIHRAIFRTLSPLPDVPGDTTNLYADNAAAATLGQKFFFDKEFSGALRENSDLGSIGDTDKVSCFTCHSGSYLDDQRSQPRTVSLGTGFHTRNAPTTINSVFYPFMGWGGRFSAPWELPPAVVESPVIMNGTRLGVAHLIFDKYKTEYEAIFGAMEPAIDTDPMRFPAEGKPKPAPTPAMPNPPDDAWEMMADADRVIVNRILVNFGKAIEAYMRLLVSRDAPFDRLVAGDEAALSEEAKRGLLVFIDKGRCTSCHQGPHLSDGLFHNLGVPQTGDRVPAMDGGRHTNIPQLLASPFNSASAYSDDINTGRLAGLTNPPPERTRGQFRTPSLRGVALTAPYMHSGQIATLRDVIDFYAAGGGTAPVGTRSPLVVPLDLTEQDKTDLLAFLETLTGANVPSALLQDTSTP